MKIAKVQMNLYVKPAVIQMVDAIAEDESRGDCVTRLVEREYKAIMRKRAAQFPTLAEVEAKAEQKEEAVNE